VADLVDLFVLLAAPGAGDELQGIKRGVMELADLVVVTKADGEGADAARHASADIRAALHLLRPRHPELTPEALLVSAVTGDGIAEVWEAVQRAHAILRDSGALDRLRSEQARAWLWSEVTATLLHRVRHDPGVQARLAEVEAAVAAGTLSPGVAAARLLDGFGG
jgi:LAO/AO transport system kinase